MFSIENKVISVLLSIVFATPHELAKLRNIHVCYDKNNVDY